MLHPSLKRFLASRSNPARRARKLLLEVLENRAVPAGFLQTNLVSDMPGMANVTDGHLLNPWGLTAS